MEVYKLPSSFEWKTREKKEEHGHLRKRRVWLSTFHFMIPSVLCTVVQDTLKIGQTYRTVPRAQRQVSKWARERVSERVSERANEWANERANEWASTAQCAREASSVKQAVSLVTVLWSLVCCDQITSLCRLGCWLSGEGKRKFKDRISRGLNIKHIVFQGEQKKIVKVTTAMTIIMTMTTTTTGTLPIIQTKNKV